MQKRDLQWVYWFTAFIVAVIVFYVVSWPILLRDWMLIKEYWSW